MNGWMRVAADRGVTAPPSRYRLYFDMHTPEYTERYGVEANIGDVQTKWLQEEHPFPIYMLDHYPQFPSSVRYPIEAVIAAVGHDYFTSTVAYALALVLTMPDVVEVGLWGIDLVHETEYGEQRPCAEYLIGRLEGKGIKVTIPSKSALLHQVHRYGYEVETPLYKEMRALLEDVYDTSKKKFEELKTKQEELHAEMRVNDAGMQVAGYIGQRLETWRRGGRC